LIEHSILVILHESIEKKEGIEEEEEIRRLLVNVKFSNEHKLNETISVVEMEKKEN
jgi:hypothetical protein